MFFKINALWFRNIKSYWRNKTVLIFSIIIPFFFIFVFGAIFKNEYIENAT
ncbi:MAG: ABC transporter permease, partial [Defluviitaleaceae bacterium]|nr:ABC transporter permease [Defluviitaleaceae bacterium]